MENCIICGNKTGFLSRKTADGRICSECRTFVPASLKLSSADKEYLTAIITLNKKKRSVFNCTAQYGDLFFDSTQGILCISKHRKNGIPLYYGDIYTFDDLEGIHLYCSDVRYSKTKRCTCTVGIDITTDSEHRRYDIYRNEDCHYFYKDGYIEVSEPERLSVFRNIINQAIKDYYSEGKRYLKQVKEFYKVAEEIKDRPKGKDKEWAKGILYLSKDDYTPEELKTQYRKLLHIFHPDINPDVDNSYAQKLNEAYKILKK